LTSKRNRLKVLILGTAVAVSCAILPARAQTSSALSGNVVDSHGLAIANAVVLVETNAGVVKRTSTDAEGKFSVSGLPAGKYTVEVDAPGFSSVVR